MTRTQFLSIWMLLCGTYCDAQEAAVEGKARFADGSPVANSLLQFRFITQRDESTRTKTVEANCVTRDDGGFSVSVPTGVAQCDVDVVAFEADQVSPRKWRTQVRGYRPGDELGLMFDDRGRILVGVDSVEHLPAGFKARIVCRSVGRGPHTAIVKEPDRKKGGIVFDRLQPGPYVLDLTITNVRQHYQTRVRVPKVAPCKASVRVSVPHLKFGRIRAHILMPDGTTPASNVSIHLHSAGRGRTVRTDESGLLEVSDILEGAVFLVPSQKRGIANVSITEAVSVVGDQLLDLGSIRLRAVNEAFGVFEGFVLYEDGSPVDPIHISHTNFDRTFHPFSGPMKLPASTPVKFHQPAKFQVQLEKGVQHVVFKFARPAGGELQIVESGKADDGVRTLVADVNIVAGKRLRKNLVMVRRNGDSTATVTHNVHSASWCVLTAVVKQGDLRWQNSAVADPRHIKQQFQHVPAGACHVVLNADNRFLVNTIPQGANKLETSFNSDDIGAMNVQFDVPPNVTVDDMTFEISRMVAGTKFLVWKTPLSPEKIRNARPIRPSMAIRLGEYKWRLNGLGPGRYTALLQSSGQAVERPVTVVVGETAPVNFSVDAMGHANSGNSGDGVTEKNESSMPNQSD